MDEPPGAAVKDRRGCVASIDRGCGITLGLLHEWEEEPIRREGRSPLLSLPLVPTDRFPAVASRSNAQTTRTTPSGGRRKEEEEAHFSSFRFPSSSLWFSCQNTHSAPLLSSLLSISKHATERLDRESEIAFWEIDGIIGSQQIRGGEERKKEGRANGKGEEEEKKTLEIQ